MTLKYLCQLLNSNCLSKTKQMGCYFLGFIVYRMWTKLQYFGIFFGNTYLLLVLRGITKIICLFLWRSSSTLLLNLIVWVALSILKMFSNSMLTCSWLRWLNSCSMKTQISEFWLFNLNADYYIMKELTNKTKAPTFYT